MFSRYVYIYITLGPGNSHRQDYLFSVGDPYKPSFATVTGWGVDPMCIYKIINIYNI